ncbi:MFS sugar transporter-like protein [Pseudomassariella vexata]|uniref:MFS sugar transporter-like protein n=1 Tax=Pseudomassariella vexata TaxID=1141098 RepID=A0A1Y2DQE1_9PEZI|nr:MFS sugar transporter-like protein [Pseudomassariella vexata]ORY61409.1 MFS sugar transporter-like protein [Pseudomassariella vexata]
MPYTVSNIYLICGFAAIGGGLFGFDISSMSGVLGTQAYIRYFDNPVSYRQGGITASMPAGSLVGSLLSSFIADRWSRKVAIQVSCVIWIIGSIIQCAAQNVGMLCAGRVIAGLCVGIASAIVPVYQSEIAPKEIRGRVVSLQQWAITWGILIQFFIQYGAAQVGGGSNDPNQPTSAFRIPWGVQMVPAFILLVGLFFFPYSPRWLASKDRWEDAIKVLAHLHGNGDVNHPKVLAEYQEIEDALRFEREEAVSSFAALVKPRIFRRVVLGMSIQMWSQLCGRYYIVYIMQGANIASPLATASIQYVINVVLTLPAILYLDKFGRRPALIVGSFLMMTFLFISGALQAVHGQPNVPPIRNEENSAITWIVYNKKSVSSGIVACSYLFVATFATTWGPTSWTYPAEIFPSKVRAKAVSLSTAANWFWNMILAFGVPPLLWNINWKMYMIFAAFNGAAFIHMSLLAPETKGYTLEEMDDVFDSGRPAWKTHKKESRLDQLAKDIEAGNVKIDVPVGDRGAAAAATPAATTSEKEMETETKAQ